MNGDILEIMRDEGIAIPDKNEGIAIVKSGVMHLDSWAGRTRTRVKVLKENKRTYRVELLEDCVKGRIGDVLKHVPHDAVTFEY